MWIVQCEFLIHYRWVERECIQQFYLLGFYFHVAFFYHLTHITVSQSVGELDQVRFVLIWNSNNFRYFIYLMKREIYENLRKRCNDCNNASAHVRKKHTSNCDTSARAAVWIWNVRWYRMIGCEIHTQTHTHWMLKITTPNFNRFGTLIIYLISQHIVAVFGRISFRISLEPNEIWLNFILFIFIWATFHVANLNPAFISMLMVLLFSFLPSWTEMIFHILYAILGCL